MKKMDKGFSPVEGLIIAAVIGLVGFGGWYVWQSRTKSSNNVASIDSRNQGNENSDSETQTQRGQDSVPSGFVHYEDEYASFYHPSDWKVERQYSFSDPYGAHSITIKAPIDTTIASADNSYQDLYFSGSILVAKNGRFERSCREDCTVYIADKVSPKEPATNGSLVVSDWDGQGSPQVVEYTRNSATVGQKQYELGFDVGQSHFARVYGSYQSGDVSFISLTNAEAVQNSKAYKELLRIIPTLVVKSQQLPQ